MSEELMAYFNKQPRLGTLSSANKEGKVDVAYFGSAHMVDEKTVIVGMGNNRTLSNLKENPNAVFMIMEPGETPAQWMGVRVYLKMTDCQTSGRKLDEIRAQIAQKVGPEIANKMIHAYVALEINEIRPFADFGQSWMKSIGKWVPGFKVEWLWSRISHRPLRSSHIRTRRSTLSPLPFRQRQRWFKSACGARHHFFNIWSNVNTMAVIGILTCEILELEFAHLLKTDPDVARTTVIEDAFSERLIAKFKPNGQQDFHQSLQLIPKVDKFTADPSIKFEVLVRVMELALHDRKKILQDALVKTALEISPHVDALFLGYGLCGNALDKPEKLLADTGVPVFIPMDEDHPVDDCVGLLLGGRTCYYGEQCKTAGTFFMIPGWTSHWRRIFDKNFGKTSTDMAKRLFAHYERSLLVTTPIMPEDEMHRNIKEFNSMFGLRTEKRAGTLQILIESWQAAKAHLGE